MNKPIVEMWNLDLKFTFINAFLNELENESLFRVVVKDKIYDKFEVTANYSKLVSKQYYDAYIACERVKVTMQGRDVLYFFMDCGKFFKRFEMTDMSKFRDPKRQKLKYFTGLDRLRNRLHGKLKVNIENAQVDIFTTREFSKFDSYMSFSLKDLYYN